MSLRPTLPWIVLTCSVLLTFLAWDVSSRAVRARLHDEFARRADRTTALVGHHMLGYEAVLRSGVALFVASEYVTRDDFRNFCRQLELERYFPGFEAVAFAKLVRPWELPRFVERVRADGFPDFEVRPPGERQVYTPITYIEPFAGRNLRAFGYDMFAEAERRRAMRRAWETGLASASGIVRLVQESERDPGAQPGFLMYLPVFLGGPVVTPEDRRSKLYGFIYSPFRIQDLMSGILRGEEHELDFALYDGDAVAPFFDTRTAHAKERPPELSAQRELHVGGRRWVFRFWSRPGFAPWISRDEPFRLLSAGIVINLLLLYIVIVNASLHRRAEKMAGEITDELRLSHAREQSHMLASLREKETLLKEIHHRVKNNLQVVSSMLSLQRSQTEDERAVEPLRQSQHRVLAMAALHEFLYQSKDLSRVDTRAYLAHLVSMLAEAYQGAGRVAIELDVADVALAVDPAISCGLITNELVSNAFKHAFAGGRTGRLCIRLKEHGGRGELALEVIDDGPGLPDTTELEAPSTLGLQLTQLLSQQLGGRLELVPVDSGAHFRVIFPRGRET